MIKDRRMKYIDSQNGIDFYIFKPSLFHLYFKGINISEDASHRKSFSHKMHMILYILFGGGYKILYLSKGNEFLSYIIYKRCFFNLVEGSTKKDIYIIFLYTFPKFRNKGYATIMSNKLLNELLNDYNNVYKTIDLSNYSSNKVAEKIGYCHICGAYKTHFLKHIKKTKNEVESHLYCYFKDSNI